MLEGAGSSSPAAYMSAGDPPHQPAQAPQQQPRQLPQLGAVLAAGLGGGAGFGSPIRLPHHPSPAKPAATAAAAASGVPGAFAPRSPAATPARITGHQPALGAAAAKTLSFGAQPAGSGAEYATPAIELWPGSVSRPSVPRLATAAGAQPLRSSLDVFLTARSTAARPGGFLTARSTAGASASPAEPGSAGPASTRSSWPAASASPVPHSASYAGAGAAASGSSAAATPGAYYSSLSGGGQREAAAPPGTTAASSLRPLLGAGGRDLEGLSASIRRMAAEMR